jgi:hypothetical protein
MTGKRLSGLSLSLANKTREKTADVCWLCVLKQHAAYYLTIFKDSRKEWEFFVVQSSNATYNFMVNNEELIGTTQNVTF